MKFQALVQEMEIRHEREMKILKEMETKILKVLEKTKKEKNPDENFIWYLVGLVFVLIYFVFGSLESSREKLKFKFSIQHIGYKPDTVLLENYLVAIIFLLIFLIPLVSYACLKLY